MAFHKVETNDVLARERRISLHVQEMPTCPSRFLASLLSPSDKISGFSTAPEG